MRTHAFHHLRQGLATAATRDFPLSHGQLLEKIALQLESVESIHRHHHHVAFAVLRDEYRLSTAAGGVGNLGGLVSQLGDRYDSRKLYQYNAMATDDSISAYHMKSPAAKTKEAMNNG